MLDPLLNEGGKALAALSIAFVLLLELVFVVLHYVRMRRRKLIAQTQFTEQATLKETAEAANRAKSEFLTQMSHDIRTPMTGVIGFTDLALRSELNCELREYLDSVRTSAEGLMHVIGEIRDFSRIEAGGLELHRTEFSFPECLRSAIEFVQPQAAIRNLRIAFKIDAQIPHRLCGDLMRLRQIIVNLLDNAVKFTSTGSVMLSAALESDSTDTITVRISVADTGIGISTEKQKSIFEPFKLADGPPNENFGGAGLGLAVSSRLVSLMGGTMDVQSQIGAGATFRFTAQLQKTPASSNTNKNESSNSARCGRPLSILLAEDDVDNQYLIATLLESAGHRITTACNGKETVALSATQMFDLILMDVQMPEMDGLEATAAIRSREGETCHVPVYALTAGAMDGDCETCLAAGMDGYVSKPIQVDELLKLIDAVGFSQPNLDRRNRPPSTFERETGSKKSYQLIND